MCRSFGLVFFVFGLRASLFGGFVISHGLEFSTLRRDRRYKLESCVEVLGS